MLEATEVAALTESVVQGKRLRDTEDECKKAYGATD